MLRLELNPVSHSVRFKVLSFTIALQLVSLFVIRVLSVYVVFEPISGRMDRASATENVGSGSIPVKLKARKIGIHSFPS